MDDFNVLIVGAGVAGSVAAYWLGKAGAKVTVIERASALPNTGQGIDIEGPSEEVVSRMGLLEEMKNNSTHEAGFAITDDNGKKITYVPGGLTREIEIMRGRMVHIFAKAADGFENVTLKFGKKIATLDQDGNKVHVSFEGGEKASFDAVIAGDGLRSATRKLAFPMEIHETAFRGLDVYAAFFSITPEKDDWPHSKMQQAPGGRTLLTRPVSKEMTSAYLFTCAKEPRLEAVCLQPRQAQKEALREVFTGIGGMAPRLVDGMMKMDDFYFDRIAQIRLEKWYTGRIALLGDAAHAPSPLTGQGSQLAIIGAYILAGELSENPKDPSAAFAKYQERCKAYFEKAQEIPLGGYAPRMINPQTTWGIWLLRTVFWLFAWSGIWKLVSFDGDPFDLPEYSKMRS